MIGRNGYREIAIAGISADGLALGHYLLTPGAIIRVGVAARTAFGYILIARLMLTIEGIELIVKDVSLTIGDSGRAMGVVLRRPIENLLPYAGIGIVIGAHIEPVVGPIILLRTIGRLLGTIVVVVVFGDVLKTRCRLLMPGASKIRGGCDAAEQMLAGAIQRNLRIGIDAVADRRVDIAESIFVICSAGAAIVAYIRGDALQRHRAHDRRRSNGSRIGHRVVTAHGWRDRRNSLSAGIVCAVFVLGGKHDAIGSRRAKRRQVTEIDSPLYRIGLAIC